MYNKKNEKNKFPMNLQLFAEPAQTNDKDGAGNPEPNVNDAAQNAENGDGEQQRKLSYEELIEKMAEFETRATNAEAEAKRQKALTDRASSEAANFKKQLVAKMTAEEQLDAAKKEAEEAREKEFNEMKNQLAVIEATKRYMTLKMDEKLAEETAKAEVAGDKETLHSNLAKHIKAIEDSSYQRALSDRPDPKAGNGDVKNSSAKAFAAAYASRKNGVNMDILNQY